MAEPAEQLIVGYLTGEPAAQQRVAGWVEKWAAPFRDRLGSGLPEVVAEAHDELVASFHHGRFEGEEALEPYVARVVRNRSITRWRSELSGREPVDAGAAAHPPVDQLIDFADSLPMGLVERDLITDHLIGCPLCVEALELARLPVAVQAELASPSATPIADRWGEPAAAVPETTSDPLSTHRARRPRRLLDRMILGWALGASLVGLALAGGWLAIYQQLRHQAGERRESAWQVEQLGADRGQLVKRAEESEIRLAAADRVLASRGAFELRQGGSMMVLQPFEADLASSISQIELRYENRDSLVLLLRSDTQMPDLDGSTEDTLLTFDGPGGKRLWSLRGPRRDEGAQGYVLLVPPSRLTEGRYTIELLPQPEARPLASYAFEVRRPF